MTESSVKISVLEELKAQHAQNYGWALTCCAWQRELAEDLLQESYLRVLDGRARYGGKSAPKTWFFGVIRHVANEMKRSRNRRRMLNLHIFRAGQGEEESEVHNPCDSPDQLALQSQSISQLRAALLQLPLRQREVLHLVFYAGCTLQESANTLQLSLGSVRTHYHRGKVRLAELLHLEVCDERGK